MGEVTFFNNKSHIEICSMFRDFSLYRGSEILRGDTINKILGGAGFWRLLSSITNYIYEYVACLGTVFFI